MTGARRLELRVVNPNTDARVTRWLVEEARRVAGDGFEVVGVNAESGLSAIQTPAELEIAARAVVFALSTPPLPFGAIVGAFGDPGLPLARALGATRIVGLGESGLLAAGEGGRRFAIVTLGAAMRETVLAKAESLGLGARLAGICVLPFTIAQVIRDRNSLGAAIAAAVRAQAADGAEAVLLGGAPFAGLAAPLARETGSIVFDGVEASVIRLVGAVDDGR